MSNTPGSKVTGCSSREGEVVGGTFPKLIFQCVTAASSQPPPNTISLKSKPMRPVTQCHHQTLHPFCLFHQWDQLCPSTVEIRARTKGVLNATTFIVYPMHATTTNMAPQPVLQTTYGPFQVTILNPYIQYNHYHSMDIYGTFILKEGIISLSLHKIRCKKITISLIKPSNFTVKMVDCLFQGKVHVETKHSRHFYYGDNSREDVYKPNDLFSNPDTLFVM